MIAVYKPPRRTQWAQERRTRLGLTTLPTVQEKPATSQPRRSKPFNTTKALELRFKGLSYTEIGSVLDPDNPYTDSTVQYHLDRFKQFIENPDALKSYEENRSSVLNALEFELLRSLSDGEAIQKASLRDRTIAFGTVFDKRRLESGKSTENLGVLGKLVVEAASEVFKKDSLITKGKSEDAE